MCKEFIKALYYPFRLSIKNTLPFEYSVCKKKLNEKFFSQNIKIGNKIINTKSSPFIVAEVSANHGNSLKNIKDIIDKVKKSGADGKISKL